MLRELYIKDIALLEQVRAQWNFGFSVITGETGSGKSLLLQALSLALGKRANRQIRRSGSKKAIVEAYFTDVNASVAEYCENAGIESQEGLLLTRELDESGKSLCRINGRIVTLATLRDLGERLVNIHGQNDYESMYSPELQLQLLDRIGGEQSLKFLQEYSDRYDAYRSKRHELQTLMEYKDPGEIQRELDLLSYEIDEIREAQLQKEELSSLEEEIKRIMHSEMIEKEWNRAHASVSAENTNALYRINEAMEALARIEEWSADAKQIYRNLEQAYFTVEDCAAQLRDGMRFEAVGEDVLDQYIRRTEEIKRLYRKYGNSYDEVMKTLQKNCDRLEEIGSREERQKALQEELKMLQEEMVAVSSRWNAYRKEVAKEMEREVAKELTELNMKGTRFEIQFHEKKFGKNGNTELRFLVSFNAGEKLQELQKIASGGEISRFMLAFKTVIAQVDEIATLVFDEIDTGVSGIAAQSIAKKLKKIGEEKQVLAITHLPQIASSAQYQYKVEKRIVKERTVSELHSLAREERVEEIAKMISGKTISKTSLENANELLNQN